MGQTIKDFDINLCYNIVVKRTPLRRVGRIGTANMLANKRLRASLGHIGTCEMRLEGCLISWPLQFAHRHKRSWYKGDLEKLSNTKQVIVACQSCHNKTEYNRELNDEVFNKIRGEE